MLATLTGIMTLFKFEQPENALFPMAVVLFGIVISARLVQLENAS